MASRDFQFCFPLSNHCLSFTHLIFGDQSSISYISQLELIFCFLCINILMWMILHQIRVVEQGNYHVIVYHVFSGVQHPLISIPFIPYRISGYPVS